MRCSQCAYDFCWTCLGQLDTHLAPHECNRYNPDASQQTRSIFYSDRFQAHEEAERYARMHLSNLDNDVQQLFDRIYNLDDGIPDIVKTTRETLLDARGFLKYSYVAAYGMSGDSLFLRSFESHQGALELVVEKLSVLSKYSLLDVFVDEGRQALQMRLRSMAFYAMTIERYMERIQSLVK